MAYMESLEIGRMIGVQWKQVIINGEQWNYDVSNSGLVRNSTNKKIIALQIDRKGYHRVTLWNKGNKKLLRVHRLVAEAFIPNPNILETVNHKNENKADNRVENLEWMSREDNLRYGTRTERMAKTNNKKVMAISLKDTKVIVFKSMKQAEKFGFNHSGISACCHGKYNQYKGFIWKLI